MSKTFDRLYRPDDFSSYIGNKIVKEKIQTLLKNNSLPHSILLEGDSGCGKTTLARIIAKHLLCKSPKEGLACNECDICSKINEKVIREGEKVQGIPLYEKDITAEGRKDEILNLIEDMKTKPIKGRKVYILDEVHEMSTKAQNSLLKVLEEPGDWLYVILCTTNPEKIINTIKTRLVTFSIKRPSKSEIKERLIEICKIEKIKYEKEALDAIIKVSGKSVRSCLKNLQQIADAYGNEVRYEDVVRDLQITSIKAYIDYIHTIKSEDVFEALNFLNILKDKYNIELEQFLDDLSEFLVDAFNIKMGVSLDLYTDDEVKEIQKVMKLIDMGEMINILNILEDTLKLRNNIKYALTMFTLKVGYPEYFNTYTKSQEKQDVKLETEKANINFIKNNKMRKKTEVAKVSPDLLLEMFADSSIIETSVMDKEE